jgi:SAM-dependent methyltransferase
VTRVLRAAFPASKIFVTDLDAVAVDWCVKQYDCIPAANALKADSFDLIWLGSVFTHLPAIAAENLLAELLPCLSESGVLVFSSQGRYAIAMLEAVIRDPESFAPYARYNLDLDSIRSLVSGYHSSGYGYVDYPGKAGYGVCCAKPQWYAERVTAGERHIQIMLQEKGIDNHQDVSAFMRADLLDARKGSLW